MADHKEREGEEEQYGVLLYYKYTSIPELDDLYVFYDSNCGSLGLLGRVRLAPHGVNVTVGGKLSSLLKHIDAVKFNSLFEGTDFKLAACHRPLDYKVAKECGFSSLSIRIVKELVTFSPHPLIKSPEISLAGRHLNAAEFHSVIQNAEIRADGKDSNCKEKLVILDARNLYETRIGKFHTPNVETLDPGIRQYSDLPSWIDDNSEKLRGNSVLMYCTGGIRCEMASAYIKSKGTGFENVYQLYGGIQRYLEQFPDGGFFRGKNFVFDHRISVGTSDNIMGTCLLCGSNFDDYSSRCRCTRCRMLVLVCDTCQKEDTMYVCELCQKHGKHIGIVSTCEKDCSQALLAIELEGFSMPDATTRMTVLPMRQGTNGPPRKLRILCLHGFRQNASSFKGRTASLAKKLKKIAELVFVDGPHELPFIYQPYLINSLQTSHPPSENCKKKFAWLVAPDCNERDEIHWKVADCPFDPLQYQQQTEGFDASLAYIKSAFAQSGPFDGILGFSQGAAMVALICARATLQDEINFRFVILCSGFALDSAEFRRDSINIPSLHIFGSDDGKDRQISSQTSRELASLFEAGCSVVIEHNSGHIIPTLPPFIDQIKDFLQRFL